jgi:hypothetical protein
MQNLIDAESFNDFVKKNPDIYYCNNCTYHIKKDGVWFKCDKNILTNRSGDFYKGMLPPNHREIINFGKENDVYMHISGYVVHLVKQDCDNVISAHYNYEIEYSTKNLQCRTDIFYVKNIIPPVCVNKSYPLISRINPNGLFLESRQDRVHLRIESCTCLEVVFWRFNVGYDNVRITKVPDDGKLIGNLNPNNTYFF